MMKELQIGDLVELVKHITLKNQTNIYGVITEITSGYYDNKVNYYTVMWFKTGESYKYEVEELIKVS